MIKEVAKQMIAKKAGLACLMLENW